MTFKQYFKVFIAILLGISVVSVFVFTLYQGISGLRTTSDKIAVHELASNKNEIKKQVEEVSEKHKELIEVNWAFIVDEVLTKQNSTDEILKSLDSLLVKLKSLKLEVKKINEIVPKVTSPKMEDFVTSSVISIEKIEGLVHFTISTIHDDSLGESEADYILEETRQATLEMTKAKELKYILYERMSEWEMREPGEI